MQNQMNENRKQEPWGKASVSFMKYHGLSSRAILVYLALKSFAGTDNIAYPGIDAIANRCDRSPATVKRAIQELKESGWIECSRRLSKSNEYYIKDYLDEDMKDSDESFQNDPTEELNVEPSNNGVKSEASSAQHDDTNSELNMVIPSRAEQIAQHGDPSDSSTCRAISQLTMLSSHKRPEEKTRGKEKNLSAAKSTTEPSQQDFALEVQNSKPHLTDYQRVMKRLHQGFKEKTGVAPVIGKGEGANVKRLLKAHSVETVEQAVDFYFTGDLWFTRDGGFSLKGFFAHYNAVVSAMSKPAKNESKFAHYASYKANQDLTAKMDALLRK